MAPRNTDTARDFAVCRSLIRDGSRSFFAASLLLPQSVRAPAYALYAFCRLSDDAVDGPDARHDSVARLQARLDRIYAGDPAPFAADRAFAATVRDFDMPRELPEALLDGLAWDAQGRRYPTLSSLQDYAARVAGTVGAMMTVLMGVRDPSVLARACDLGVAMQLTNIARDVGEDARNGRVYLPLDWLAGAGIDPDAFVARPVFDPRIAGLVQRLLAVADDHYRRSVSGVGGLPVACRPAIHAARLIYREIGREIERNGWDSVRHRAVVPTTRKIALLCAALGATTSPAGVARHPPLPETQFLVDSAVRLGTPAGLPGWPVPDGLRRTQARLARITELFVAIDERRLASGGRRAGAAAGGIDAPA